MNNAPLIGLLLLLLAVLLFFAAIVTVFHWTVQWFKDRRAARAAVKDEATAHEEEQP